MNAHTTIKPAPYPVANQLEYGPAVWAHYPDEGGVRLAIRCDLMAFRDRAAVGLQRCCDEAAPALQEAARLTTIYALANIPTRAMFQMHMAARALIEAATAIEGSVRDMTKFGTNDARG